MNIYLISQRENCGYDTFDSAVVYAENEEAAKRIHPDGHLWESDYWNSKDVNYTWASCPDAVEAKLIGTSSVGGISEVTCSSFNAG